VKVALHYDYTAVGHVTIDVMDDGSSRVGGTALYSGLQAARLGRRTLIVTQGAPRELDRLLEPFAGELDVEILPAPHTTTLRSSGSGPARLQSVLAWAGPMPAQMTFETAILHLAPVARETPARWRAKARVTGMTPQGLARQWPAAGGPIGLCRPGAEAELLAGACDALVLSEHERDSCSEMIALARTSGTIVSVTDGPRANRVSDSRGAELRLEVPTVAEALDDLGAGDVYAAAFFIALDEGLPAADAAHFAMAAAAVRMRASGAQAIGGREAVEARLAEVRSKS
jgi:sugar/nucleoside kinase (ribokinase family)